MIDAPSQNEERLLVLAPSARDAEFCGRLLGEAHLAVRLCADLEEVCGELEHGAGAVLLCEEALAGRGAERLDHALAQQPSWSDLPLLVLAQEGDTTPLALQTLEMFGNVTLLERPVRIPTLVSAARSALRARRRQYQIRDQLREARRITEALREADRSKDEFLAMLAHELRNPLAPLRNALYILRQERADAAVAGRLRDMMDRQVGQLVRLVDDLLDVSRILRGKIELQVERLDLAAVIARAVETAQPLIDAQRHELTVTLLPTQIEVEGDLVRLSQVFANLLNNAAKYTEPGGHIWLAGERAGDEVVVQVRDDGIGIAAEMLPRVFELFSQADRSLDRSQGGLGLGLTLVRRLVELHGGRVEVFSDGPGQGSEFVVRLPSPAPASRPTGASHEEDGAAYDLGPPRRILVVDDNVDAANSLAELLSLAGHQVAVAHHGDAALRMAEETPPEVVLLDIGLPGLSGYGVARRLRELDPGMVLVAVTGYGQRQDRRRAIDAGFDHHLTKPAHLGDLARILHRSAAGRERRPDRTPAS